MATIKCFNCFSEPKHFIRFLAIVICVCTATYQLSGCISKVLHPPTTTHNSFQLNHTLQYPSLTICRNPGFRIDQFKKYGLVDVSEPWLTSFWKDFNFKNFSLDEFFKDTTYGMEDVIPLHGFDGKLDSLEIQEINKLTYGKCFKLIPKFLSTRWDIKGGYCLFLMAGPRYKKAGEEMLFPQKIVKFDLQTMLNEQSKYGFHVFMHEPTERIFDNGDQSNSFMEHIFIGTQKDVEYSLSVHEYKNLPSKDNDCRNEQYYSKSMCEEQCLAEVVTKEVGCTAPWLENKSFPRCSTYDQTKSLIKTYNEFSKRSNENCNCPRSCNITIYMPHVNDAKSLDYGHQTAFRLYFLSNLVTVTEEIAIYDWSLFISDLGGSLGFLLGLSVLGLISMVEQIFKIFLSARNIKLRDPGQDDAKKNLPIVKDLPVAKINHKPQQDVYLIIT